MTTFVIRGGPTPAQVRKALDGAFSTPHMLINFPLKHARESLTARIVGFEYANNNDFGHCWITVQVEGYEQTRFEYHHDHRGGRGELELTTA